MISNQAYQINSFIRKLHKPDCVIRTRGARVQRRETFSDYPEHYTGLLLKLIDTLYIMKINNSLLYLFRSADSKVVSVFIGAAG